MLHGPPPSLFQNYVTTLYQTQDFVAHHGLHSSDAYLLAGPRVDRCADLSAKDYAGFMRLVCDQVHWDATSLKTRQPYFQDATLRATFEDGGEVVALVSLREAHSGALVHAAYGVGVRGLRDAPHHAGLGIGPGVLEVDPLLALDGQVGVVRLHERLRGDPLHARVHVHELHRATSSSRSGEARCKARAPRQRVAARVTVDPCTAARNGQD